MRRLTLLLLALVLLLPAAPPAQWRSGSLAAAVPAPPDNGFTGPERPVLVRQDNGAMLLGGLLGGAVGLAGGAAIGYSLDVANGCQDDYFCGVGGGLLGALVGESVMLPLGVHLANGARGNAGWGMLASSGIGAVGLLAAAVVAIPSEGQLVPVALIAIPVAQLAATVELERRAERRRASSLPPAPLR